MPAAVSGQPPRLTCVFSDGSRATFSLGTPDSIRLGGDLLVGLAELVHPHGTVDAASTVGQYIRAARRMATTLAEQGFTGGAGELTRTRLAEYWMSATVSDE